MGELTVKEFAAQERVTDRTVRLWMAKGAIAFRHTPGGGVRIPKRQPASPTPAPARRGVLICHNAPARQVRRA